MFAAQGARTNPYKDFETLRGALELLHDRRLLAVALGEGGPEERIGSVTLRSEPFQGREEVAKWLRRADVYVHATKADNHPLAVLEALACGVPVVARSCGRDPGAADRARRACSSSPGIHRALAAAISELLADDERRARMGAAAAADARARFSLDRQVDAYLDLYAELC